MCWASSTSCGGGVLSRVAAVCQFSLQGVCCYMTLLDYELFPVLTTVNNVAVKILVHVLMHVAKNSSRTSKLGSPAECVVCLFYLKKKNKNIFPWRNSFLF